MSDKSKNIASRIKFFRKIRKMSQDDLSRESGINLSQLKKYEVGLLNPKLETLKVLADTLGISLYSLIDLHVNTVSDIISIVLCMDDQTTMHMTGKKDKNGQYIPDSVRISFDDDAINIALAKYMDIKESESVSGDSLAIDFETKIDDVELLIEDSKTQLFLNDEKVIRPEG